jgi:hypothetical protein
MPEIIKLAKFSKDLEQRIRSIEGLVLAGEPLPLKLNYIGGYTYLKNMADRLLEHGLDEALVFTGGEEVEGLKPGWLPVHGSDLVKVLRAYVSAGYNVFYEDRALPWRMWMPAIATYGDEVFVQWPSVTGYPAYRFMMVRLADASLGERFTTGIEFEKIDDATLDMFRLRFETDLANMPNAFKMMGLEDYLKLAGRISRYAVDLYRETGYPVQTLQPFLPFGTSSVAAVVHGRVEARDRSRALGEPLGYLWPYDPRFEDLYANIHLRKGVYFDPWMSDLDDDHLLKIVTSLVANGERIHEEPDGSGLYLLDIEEQREALEEGLGPVSYRFLTKYLERLGEGLYLLVEPTGSKHLYSYHPPPPEYLPVALLGQAFNAGGSYLRAEVEGLPDPFLQIFTCYFEIEDRIITYTFATRPKRIQVRDGIYLDKESGVGIVVY